MTAVKNMALDGKTLERVLHQFPGITAEEIAAAAPHWAILQDMAGTLRRKEVDENDHHHT